MVSKKLQKEWRYEADKKFPEFAEIFKIFSDSYSPRLIATFFLATKKEADKIVRGEASKAEVLGLFADTWQLAIKKSCPPCCKADFLSLLSEAKMIWENDGCWGITIDALREIWFGKNLKKS